MAYVSHTGKNKIEEFRSTANMSFLRYIIQGAKGCQGIWTRKPFSDVLLISVNSYGVCGFGIFSVYEATYKFYAKKGHRVWAVSFCKESEW